MSGHDKRSIESQERMDMDFRLFALMVLLLTFLPACRTMTEGDAAAKRETAGGVSVVAVQYVASMSWPFSNFTDPSHFMV